MMRLYKKKKVELNKYISINCEENIILEVNDISLEKVEKISYLNSIVSSDEETTIGISKRINKAVKQNKLKLMTKLVEFCCTVLKHGW